LNYSYFEPTKSLQVRINAHKKYSHFSLEDYLKKKYHVAGGTILDMGCGNGNMTEILSENTRLYIGVDNNSKSLSEAHNQFKDWSNVFFMEHEMDDDLYFPHCSFNHIFFIYSSYYSNNPEKLFSQCRQLLKENGSVVLFGPTEKNAWEIDDFCLKMFGNQSTSKSRAHRIEHEYIDLFQSLGLKTEHEKISFDLTFPSYNEYMKYIQATLQYREAYNETFDESLAEDLVNNQYGSVLTKEVIMLCGSR